MTTWPLRCLAVACAGALASQGTEEQVTNPSAPSDPIPVFVEVAEQVGLRFRHQNGATGQYYLPEIMGSGGALVDVDLDGDLDVVLVQGGALGEGLPSDAGPSLRLFRNELARSGKSSTLRFMEVTHSSGFMPGGYGMGIAVGDYDNDADPDLYLTCYGPNRLYRNDGRGRFVDVTALAGGGLDDPRWSTSASFSDYDLDGDLDLYVTNYVDFSVGDNKVCHSPAGVRDYCGPLQFRPVPDRLFRNEGNGTFTDVTAQAGLDAADGGGLGVLGADLDGDRWPDFYVANDGTANQLWLNRKGDRFEDHGLLSGVALNMDGTPEGSMGIAAGDPDNDGDLDLFVTNIARETHAFYRNLGQGRFADARLPFGLGAPTAPFTGFGAGWLDYDADGWLDLFSANGAVTMGEGARRGSNPYGQRNQLLRNRSGAHLQDVTAAAGTVMAPEDVSRGAAFGDVDNDGDTDILVTTNAGPVRLLLNHTPQLGDSVHVQLVGREDNRQGVGARVGLVRSNGKTIWRRVQVDGSYLSAHDPRVHFAVPRGTAPRAIIVEWLRGRAESWAFVPGTTHLRLTQGTGKSAL